MQIQLKQSEIETAVRQYIGRRLTGEIGEIVFTAGRSGNGITATVDIDEPVEQVPTNTKWGGGMMEISNPLPTVSYQNPPSGVVQQGPLYVEATESVTTTPSETVELEDTPKKTSSLFG